MTAIDEQDSRDDENRTTLNTAKPATHTDLSQEELETMFISEVTGLKSLLQKILDEKYSPDPKQSQILELRLAETAQLLAHYIKKTGLAGICF